MRQQFLSTKSVDSSKKTMSTKSMDRMDRTLKTRMNTGFSCPRCPWTKLGARCPRVHHPI